MKRILVVAFSFLIVLASCDTLKKVASILVPSEFEMATGLKDALTQGLFKSFDAFADPNGNPLVRFAFGKSCKTNISSISKRNEHKRCYKNLSDR